MQDITVNGVNLKVHVQGSGSPLFALHGAPGNSSHVEPSTSFGPLSDRHTVITYDARGSGESDAVGPYSHEQWVADLDALREHFGYERIILGGGSYGGFIALEYAIRHPQRVSHLILRDTAARDWGEQAKENARMRAPELGISEEVLNKIFDGTVEDNDDYRRCFTAIAPLYDVNFDAAKSAERIAATRFNYETKNWAFARNLPDYDIREQLKSLQVPTLITVGRHDWITPVAASEELHSVLPNSELVVFENSGHSPQKEESAAWLATIRDFLRRHGTC